MTATDAPSGRDRGWWVVGAVAAIVIGATLALVVLERRSEQSRARVGEVLTGHAVEPAQVSGIAPVEVATPYGYVTVRVGDPGDTVPFAEGGDQIAPPEGGSLVPLYLAFEPSRSLPFLSTSGRAAGASVEVALRSGDDTFPLGDALSAADDVEGVGGFAVAVPGAPGDLSRDDLAVVVGFAGVDQVVDLGEQPGDDTVDRGDAVALYDLPVGRYRQLPDAAGESAATPCGTPSWTGGFGPASADDRARCEVYSALRLPYVGGLGWAERGTVWLVVVVGHDDPFRVVRTRDGVEQEYVVHYSGADAAYTVDGEPVLLAKRYDVLQSGAAGLSTDDRTPDLVVASVPAGREEHRLGTELTYVGYSGPAGATPEPRIVVRWQTPVRPVGGEGE